MKSYIIKFYNNEGNFLHSVGTNTNPDQNILLNQIRFKSKINGGQGELRLSFKMKWDDHESWIQEMNFVRVFAVDTANPTGRLIYSGFISRIESFAGRTEEVTAVCLGLVSLLSLSLYKDGSEFDVVKEEEEPKDIIEEIITNFQSVYPPSSGDEWIGFDAVPGIRTGGQIQAFGSNISLTFEKAQWIRALIETVAATDEGWAFFIDAGGDVIVGEKPSSATHIFTLQKDLQEVVSPTSVESVINSVTMLFDGGSVTSQDTASTIAYGKREQFLNRTDIKDEVTAQNAADKIIADNKDPKIEARLKINSDFDIESIKPGHTCKIRNLKKDSTVFENNMRIVAVDYSRDFVVLDLEKDNTDFGAELSNFTSTVVEGNITITGGGFQPKIRFAQKNMPAFANTAVELTGDLDGVNAEFEVPAGFSLGRDVKVNGKGIAMGAVGSGYPVEIDATNNKIVFSAGFIPKARNRIIFEYEA